MLLLLVRYLKKTRTLAHISDCYHWLLLKKCEAEESMHLQEGNMEKSEPRGEIADIVVSFLS